MFEAYAPLGSPARKGVKSDEPVVMEDPVIKEIAEKHGATPGQVQSVIIMYNYPGSHMDQRWNIMYAGVYKGIFIDPIKESKRHILHCTLYVGSASKYSRHNWSSKEHIP